MFDWFWRQLYGDPKEEKETELEGRIYHFPLPHRIEVIYLHYGLAMLKQEGIWEKLPKDLQERWKRSTELWHPLKVTREDLDRIDDDTWAKIAAKLNLKWENSA